MDSNSSKRHQKEQRSPHPKPESLPSISNLFNLANKRDQIRSESSSDNMPFQGSFHGTDFQLPQKVKGNGAGLPLPWSSRGKFPLPSSESPGRVYGNTAVSMQRSLSSSSPTSSSSSTRDSLRSLDEVATSLPSPFGAMRGTGPTQSLYCSSSSSFPSPASRCSDLLPAAPSPKPPRAVPASSATTAFSIEDEMDYEIEAASPGSSLDMQDQSHPSFTFPPKPLSTRRSISSSGTDSVPTLHRSPNPTSMMPPPSRSAGVKPESSWTKHQRAETEDGFGSQHSAAPSFSSSTSSSSSGKRRAEDHPQPPTLSGRRRHTLGAADAPDPSASSDSSRLSLLNPRSSLGADLTRSYSQFLLSQQAASIPPVPPVPRLSGVANSQSSPSIPAISHHHHHPYQIPSNRARNSSTQSRQSSHGTSDSYSSSRDSYLSANLRDSSYFSSNRDSNSHLSIRSGLPLPQAGGELLPDSPTTPTGPPDPTSTPRNVHVRASHEFVPRTSNRASTSTFSSSTSSLPLTHSARSSLPSLSSGASGVSASSLSLSFESRSNHSRNSTVDSIKSSNWNTNAIGSQHVASGSTESHESTRVGAPQEEILVQNSSSASRKSKSGKSKKKKKPRLPPRSSSLQLREDFVKEWEVEARDGWVRNDYETEGTYQDESPESNSDKSNGNENGSGGSNGGVTPSQSQQAWSNRYGSPDSAYRNERERNISDGSRSASSSGSSQSRPGFRSTQGHAPLQPSGPGFFLPQRISSMDLDEAYRRDQSQQSHAHSYSGPSNSPVPLSSPPPPPHSNPSFSNRADESGSKSIRRISASSIASDWSGNSSGASSFHSIPLAHSLSTDSDASFSATEEISVDPTSSFVGAGADPQPNQLSSGSAGNENLSSTAVSAPSSAVASSSVSTTGTGKYECEYCKKRFTRPSSLKIHTHTHTGERPFVCPEPSCGRSFSVQSNLRRHQKAHLKERAESETIPEGIKVDSISRSDSHRSKISDSFFDTEHPPGRSRDARESSPAFSSSNFASSPAAEQDDPAQFPSPLCPTRPNRASSTSSNFSTGIRERFEGMMGEN